MSSETFLSIEVPFKCPFTTCSEFVSSSNLLCHLMQVHNVDVKEVEEFEKITMILNHEYLSIGESICIGVLAMKSKKIVQNNALLPFEVRNFKRNLPVLIMTSLENFNTESSESLVDANNDTNHELKDQNHYLSVWLAAPLTMKDKVWGTVTFHDGEMKKSLSSLIRVRRVERSQKLNNFLTHETDHLTSGIGFISKIKNEVGFLVELSLSEELH